MSTRIGVDIGGTFTDLIYYDDNSTGISVVKVPTTVPHPDEGCINAISHAVSKDKIPSVLYFLHGTTVGLNALLERRGAVVGLLTTSGFRDVLELRRGDRDEIYNLFWKPPIPLVPRRLRLNVDERIMSTGDIIIKLNRDDIRQALNAFKQQGVTSIAIVFINSYANPAHEIQAEEELRALGFDGEISVSHRASGEYREYERTTTTVIDAFVRANMSSYLQRLSGNLAEQGFRGDALLTRSGGGSLTFSEAQERPFETLMSGPVAGVQAAAELSRRNELAGVITADVGGTSFDTSLIINGRKQLMYEGSIEGLPVQAPWVDVRSIGAGGGSIAYVDAGGLLRVGPHSAGANPGPACYGRGGDKPTVSDAAFLLGMLGEGKLASGIELDAVKASGAMQPVAEMLDFSIDQTAQGILSIASASMANAIREITTETGTDPRNMTLLAFGGAGPLMGTLLAQELGIANIIVPPIAGNFSAWGLMTSDLVRTTARTKIMKLSGDCIEQVKLIAAELFLQLQKRRQQAPSSQTGINRNDETATRELGLDMRYVGQDHSLTINIATQSGTFDLCYEELMEKYVKEYKRTFDSIPDGEVEIVTIRAAEYQALPALPSNIGCSFNDDRSKGESKGSIDVYSFSQDSRIPFTILERAVLSVGQTLTEPAIIHEVTTTTYLDTGYHATVDSSGSLIIKKQ